jgi:hypothetical protein
VPELRRKLAKRETIPSFPQAALRPISSKTIPDNFNRAKTDLYFGTTLKEGSFGKVDHQGSAVDRQTNSDKCQGTRYIRRQCSIWMPDR